MNHFLWLVLLCGVLGWGCVAGAEVTVCRLAIDDRAVEDRLREEGEKLIKGKDFVAASALRAQLARTNCTIDLPRVERKPLKDIALYERGRSSVIVMGGLFKCGKCAKLHLSTGAGFAIARPSVFLTNYHVVDQTNVVIHVAMDAEGKVAPITEILAADKNADWAIVRVPGLELKPLPLREIAPVGAEVFLVSHPNEHFFSFCKGNVARYGKKGACTDPKCKVHKGDKVNTWWMEITADFGYGASGGPVMDECGNVVGMISRVDGQGPEAGKPGLMIFKQCVPMEFVMRTIGNLR